MGYIAGYIMAQSISYHRFKIFSGGYGGNLRLCNNPKKPKKSIYIRAAIIKSGMIPATKFGRHWKIPRSVFSSYDRGSKDYRQITGGMKGTR